MYLILLFISTASGFTVFYFFLNPQFGGKIEKTDILKYALSPNWKNGKFHNLEKTTMNINAKTLPSLLKEQTRNAPERTPEKPLEVLPFDLQKFDAEPEKSKFVWYGHSVLLLQINGKNLLIDPMFGSDASPIGPVRTKRFSEDTLEIIDSLPKIDAVLFTHDHYDHIDLHSIEKLKNKVDTFFVGLGIGRHLVRWGIDEAAITEFDWWQSIVFEGIEIHYTPSRHFTGRGLSDRAKSLWGGWVFKAKNESLYWSGDGGYGKHFKEIGQKLGPFDFAFMECGQYNENWHQIHLHPEETVQAAIDAGAKKIMPVHWAGFKLALHPWKEPVERFTAEAKKQNLSYLTPRIGEIITFKNEHKTEPWFESLN